ncbi:MAG: hypothetical protein ABW071_03810, partial [Casimicrobiaceae bacterium]
MDYFVWLARSAERTIVIDTGFNEAAARRRRREMVRNVYAGRVEFHDGDAQIAPGLSVHHIGGHTAGLQAVRIWTRI